MESGNTPTESTTQLPPEKIKIFFHGKASEYFRIWIVNLALTVVTLGIYSAWAKVRAKKYLYGNIEISGSRFDYHADPIKILIGRILVGVLFIGYSVGGKISPLIAGVFILMFAVIFPWLMVRALIFALSNTSCGNIRFGFKKDYQGSYETYLKAAMIWIFTLGFCIPYSIYLHTYFRIHRIRFGNQDFSLRATASQFFKLYYSAVGIILCSGLAMLFIILVFGKGPILTTIGIVVLYSGLILAGAYLRTGIINILGNKTQLGSIKFECNLKSVEVMWIYISNFMACILTLGLATPWAVIRSLKYRIDHSQILAPIGAISKLHADIEVGSQNVCADAAVDFWDIDIGF